MFRFFLNLSFVFLFLNLLPILSYIAELLHIKSKIIILLLSIAVSLPIYNLIFIIISNGKTSFIDQLSKCTIAKKNVSNKIGFKIPSIKKHFGLFILNIAFTLLIIISINWKYTFLDRSSNSLSSINFNPIYKMGNESNFLKYNRSGFPVISFISKEYNYFLPYKSFDGINSVIVYIFPKESLFADKSQHYNIAKEIHTFIRNYNIFSKNGITQAKLIIRKFSHFSPFTFISDYTYLIQLAGDSWSIIGDWDEIRLEKFQSLINEIKSHKIDVDSAISKIDLPYAEFTEPSLVLLFHIGNNFPYSIFEFNIVDDKVKEWWK